MSVRKQQPKVAGKMGVTVTSMTPGKAKGLKMAKRIKAIRKINLASFTTRIPTPTRRANTGKTWIASVRKTMSYNKGRNNYNIKNNKNMIIIHNNTSITGNNNDLYNRTSCVHDISPASTNDTYDEIHRQLSTTAQSHQQHVEIKAAIHIQSVFRAHLARRACRALKSLVKLQAMARGVCVRRQARIALDCMNALSRLQFRVRARQLRNKQHTSLH